MRACLESCDRLRNASVFGPDRENHQRRMRNKSFRPGLPTIRILRRSDPGAMPSSPSSEGTNPEAVDAPVLAYDPDAFAQRLESLMADRDARTGTRLLFYGGVREHRQQALATLTRHATGNVHQFQMASLLGGHRMQTQNNLRKAFDHAAEESALLYFDKSDSIFTHTHADSQEDPEENAVPTTVEYFFDRVGAYAGVVVLGLQRKRHVEWARDKVHLVVRFE